MPLQPGDGGLQQEQVLEHPAGQRDRAQAVALAQQQAAVGDQAGHTVVEARGDDPPARCRRPGPRPTARIRS